MTDTIRFCAYCGGSIARPTRIAPDARSPRARPAALPVCGPALLVLTRIFANERILQYTGKFSRIITDRCSIKYLWKQG
jgi:hypothetical protein